MNTTQYLKLVFPLITNKDLSGDKVEEYALKARNFSGGGAEGVIALCELYWITEGARAPSNEEIDWVEGVVKGALFFMNYGETPSTGFTRYGYERICALAAALSLQ